MGAKKLSIFQMGAMVFYSFPTFEATTFSQENKGEPEVSQIETSNGIESSILALLPRSKKLEKIIWHPKGIQKAAQISGFLVLTRYDSDSKN